MDKEYEKYKEFNETNVKTYPFPFGKMATEIVEELEKEPWFYSIDTTK